MNQSTNKLKVIVAGSEGLLGKEIVKGLSNIYDVIRLDLILGHDLTNESEVKILFKENKMCHGLVNLFCINPQPDEDSLSMFDLSLDSIREYLEVNIVGLFSVCREFSRTCLKDASIVNFSSTYGVLSPKHFIYDDNFTKHIGYTITKSAVVGMSKYLATYLAPSIRVNTIVPGGVENNQDREFQNNYSSMTPMRRMMNKKEIVSAVSYFLSKDSSYTTGSLLNVDGGWTSW